MPAISLSFSRTCIYTALVISAFLTLCLTSARLAYTTNIPRGDTLNGGRNYHDPIVVELLVAALFSLAWAPYAIYVIRHYAAALKLPIVASSFLTEIGALSLLWLFLTIGAGQSSTKWGDLAFCANFVSCRVLTAMLAFAWISWSAVTVALGISLALVLTRGRANVKETLSERFHGQWEGHEVRAGVEFKEARAESMREMV